jgi:hypothetical protein
MRLAVLLICCVASACMNGCGGSPKSPATAAASPAIEVQVDSAALAMMERLHAKRPAMEALAAKERSANYKDNPTDQRKFDALDALADSCAALMSARITGVSARTLGSGTGPLIVLQYEKYNPDPMVLFCAYVNYGSRVSSGVLPTASAGLSDIADVGARLAPKLLRLYPRLEYVEIREVGPVVIASLHMTRKALGVVEETSAGFISASKGTVSGLGYDDHAGVDAFSMGLNEALVRMGKLR